MTLEQLENELKILPAGEKLRLARWLLDTLIEKHPIVAKADENPLLNIAGRFSGGPGDSAERAEKILASEVNPVHGLGVR